MPSVKPSTNNTTHQKLAEAELRVKLLQDQVHELSSSSYGYKYRAELAEEKVSRLITILKDVSNYVAQVPDAVESVLMASLTPKEPTGITNDVADGTPPSGKKPN